MRRIKLCAIVAMSENRVIGKDNRLIWHLPADLKHFKDKTMGKPLVMGRKSFNSLPGILPGRPHVVVSRSDPGPEMLGHDNVYCVNDIEKAINKACVLAHEKRQSEVFITGGGEIYKQTLPVIERLYLTIVHADYEGDTFFPKLEWEEWKITDTQEYEAESAKNRPSFTIMTLDRR